MHYYIQKLKSFLETQKPYAHRADASAILEILYYYYTSDHPVDSALLRCQFRELGDIVQQLPFAQQDAIISLASTLCAGYERQAFLDGTMLGAQLMLELGKDACG